MSLIKIYTLLVVIANALASSFANSLPRRMHFGKCFEIAPYNVEMRKSLESCQTECVTSSECKGVVYDSRLTLCSLHDTTGTALRHCPGKVLVLRDDILKTTTEVCGADSCPTSDCGSLPVISGDAKTSGNQVKFNSVVKVTCRYNNDVTYVDCQNSGDWNQVPNCVNPDCGNPRSYPNMVFTPPDSTLVGSEVTYTCTAHYRFEPPALEVTSHCLTNESMNALACVSDADCNDDHSVCIGRSGSVSSRRCFCKANFTYNMTYEVCDNECTLASGFAEKHGYKILEYMAGHVYTGVSLQQCKDACDTIPAIGADYIYEAKECYCNKITHQQASVTDPSVLRQSSDSILLSKTCA